MNSNCSRTFPVSEYSSYSWLSVLKHLEYSYALPYIFFFFLFLFLPRKHWPVYPSFIFLLKFINVASNDDAVCFEWCLVSASIFDIIYLFIYFFDFFDVDKLCVLCLILSMLFDFFWNCHSFRTVLWQTLIEKLLVQFRKDDIDCRTLTSWDAWIKTDDFHAVECKTACLLFTDDFSKMRRRHWIMNCYIISLISDVHLNVHVDIWYDCSFWM